MPVAPPVEVNVGGTAASASNPLSVTSSVAGSAISATNPLPVAMTGIGDTVAKGGTAAAPGAGAAIVTLTANQPAGLYRVSMVWSISGAIETAGLNVRLTDASSSFTAIDFPSNNGSVGGQSWTQTIDRLNVTSATNTIKVVAIAAAVASTVYSVNLAMTRIG